MITRTTEPIDIKCSLVCTLNKSSAPHIIIEDEFLWLDSENDFIQEVDVLSNTEWDIM